MRSRQARTSKVEALTLKPGPSQSGAAVTKPPPGPVGGVMLPVDKLSVFLANYWILLVLILLLPLGLIFYKKRETALRLLTPLLSRF